MRLRTLFPLLASLCVALAAGAQTTLPDSAAVLAALRYQRENYPASRLRDVYKNFFDMILISMLLCVA